MAGHDRGMAQRRGSTGDPLHPPSAESDRKGVRVQLKWIEIHGRDHHALCTSQLRKPSTAVSHFRHNRATPSRAPGADRLAVDGPPYLPVRHLVQLSLWAVPPKGGRNTWWQQINGSAGVRTERADNGVSITRGLFQSRLEDVSSTDCTRVAVMLASRLTTQISDAYFARSGSTCLPRLAEQRASRPPASGQPSAVPAPGRRAKVGN